MSAYETDFAALGLQDHSPFAILGRPKATPAEAPNKRKVGRPSKLQMSITALDTPEERKARRTELLLKSKHHQFSIGKETDADKAKRARLVGKSNHSRSQ